MVWSKVAKHLQKSRSFDSRKRSGRYSSAHICLICERHNGHKKTFVAFSALLKLNNTERSLIYTWSWEEEFATAFSFWKAMKYVLVEKVTFQFFRVLNKNVLHSGWPRTTSTKQNLSIQLKVITVRTHKSQWLSQRWRESNNKLPMKQETFELLKKNDV